MSSTLAKMTHKVADKIDEMGQKNKQSNHTNNTDYGTTHDGYNMAGGAGGLGSSGTGYGDNTYGGSHTGNHGTGMHTGHHNTAPGYGTSANATSFDNPHSMNTGPHNSNMMNKLDPRIDSDRDGRNDLTSHAGEYGHTQSGYNSGLGHHGTAHGHHATTDHGIVGSDSAAYSNSQSTTTGPHKSNLLNKLDPRVDSDRDGRNNLTSTTGGYGTSTTTTHSPTVVTQTTHSAHHGSNHGHTGSNVGYDNTQSTHHGGNHGNIGSNTGYDNPQSTNAGPHKSNLMNKLDPRVDSDRDGRNDPTSRTGGHGNTQTDGYGNTQIGGYGNTHNSGSKFY